MKDEGEDVLVEVEVALVKNLGWCLRDIDETDIESLLPFIARLTAEEKAGIGDPGYRKVYCDEVGWL
jgi:hypothetical protein